MFEPEPDSQSFQLTFDVGGAAPDVASLKVSGGMGLSRELRKGEPVEVRVISADGEILCEGSGHVSSVMFKDKRNSYGDVESTERAHTVRLA